MARELTEIEKEMYIDNRGRLLDELRELQADFEDFSDYELVQNRETMRERINICLRAILENDTDNEEV